MSVREDYTRRLEERLKEWDARLDALRERAEQSGAGLRDRFDTQRAHLVRLRGEMADTLSRLSEKGEAAWDETKTRAEDGWDKMTEALEKLSAHFPGKK